MSLLDRAAKAAYEGAFLKHAPEYVDRWEDLVADGSESVESWRAVARQVLLTVADEVYGDERAAGPHYGSLSIASWLRAECTEPTDPCGDYPAPCNHDPAHTKPSEPSFCPPLAPGEDETCTHTPTCPTQPSESEPRRVCTCMWNRAQHGHEKRCDLYTEPEPEVPQ